MVDNGCDGADGQVGERLDESVVADLGAGFTELGCGFDPFDCCEDVDLIELSLDSGDSARESDREGEWSTDGVTELVGKPAVLETASECNNCGD
jgi:hypothetical protein